MKQTICLLGVIAVLSTSCGHFMGRRIRGNGTVKTSERTVSPFTKVESEGNFNIIVSQGTFQPVKIEADENLMSYIEVVNDGDKLIIREKADTDLQPSDDIKIYVTAPSFRSIDISGAGDLTSTSKITNPEALDLTSSGAGKINMELDAPSVKVDVSGAASIMLKGQTKSADMTLSGAGSLKCFDLMSEEAKVEVSGVGNAEVYASVKLDAEVNGVGSIHYKGSPGSVNQQVSGVGSISAVK